MLKLGIFVLLTVLSSVGLSYAEHNVVQRDTRSDGTRESIAGFPIKIWPAVIGLVLYTLTAMLHWLHLVRIGQRFMLTLTIGMTCMSLGFLLRIVYSNLTDSLGLYIIMIMFILLSPCAFLATDYMLLSRMAHHLGKDIADACLLIPSHRITKIFVWSDVFTFLLQGNGGGLTSSDTASTRKLGTTIVLIGLILQLLSFGLFTLLLIMFGLRVRSNYPNVWSGNTHGQSLFSVMGPFKRSKVYDWRILFYSMCLTCVAILIRSAFRIIEYAEGNSGFLGTHEGYFYLLDALPLWIGMSLYALFWPTRFIKQENGFESMRLEPQSQVHHPIFQEDRTV